MPVTFTTIYDGTPALSWRRVVREISATKTVVREAGNASEVLIIRGLVHIGGTVDRTTPIVTPCRPMKRHTHLEMFTAIRDWHELPMDYKPEGVCILPYVADRGGGNSLRRVLFQRVAEWGAAAGIAPGAEDRELRAWPLDIPCVAHDYHASFMEGLAEVGVLAGSTLRNLSKSIFKALRSCRESMTELIEQLTTWVPRHVYFDGAGDDPDLVRAFWQALGLEEHIVELLVWLDLLWVNGRLRVRASRATTPEIYDNTIDALMGVFRFLTFSQSRWIGSTCPCGRLVAGQCVGLDSLVDSVLGDPETGDWYLQCYRKLDEGARLHTFNAL